MLVNKQSIVEKTITDIRTVMDVETRLRDVQRRIKTGMVRMETVTRTLRSLAVKERRACE